MIPARTAALVAALTAVLGCGGSGSRPEPDADPRLTRCPEGLAACYAPCPQPTWVTRPTTAAYRAVGRAPAGGRAHSRAIGAAREVLAREVVRAIDAAADPLRRALAAMLASDAGDPIARTATELGLGLAKDVLTVSQVAQVYEDCVTDEVHVLVAMDPQRLVELACEMLGSLDRAEGLFRSGARERALGAARQVLAARLLPEAPAPETAR